MRSRILFSTFTGAFQGEADTRNIQGLVLYHPIIVDSPWKAPVNVENKILDLIRERDPLLIARAYPDLSQVWDHYEYDRLYEASMVAIYAINYHITGGYQGVIAEGLQVHQSHFPCTVEGYHT